MAESDSSAAKLSSTRRSVLTGAGIAIGGLTAASSGKVFAKSISTPFFATLLSGEPSATSIILQARVSTALAVPGDFNSDSPGVAGHIRFEIADNSAFSKSLRTEWSTADAADDFIVQKAVEGLSPATAYHFRIEYRDDRGRVHRPTAIGRFATLTQPDASAPVTFAVLSCMSYELFYALGKPSPYPIPKGPPSSPQERRRGYPAMDVIRASSPAFIVATGDTVYYDHPGGDDRFWATTVPQMRQKWHRQMSLPSVKETFGSVATFYMKDDHDFRYDDADNTGNRGPSPADGKKIFLEQVPVVQTGRPTYRTARVNRHLQIWLLENRDFRSPNAMPDTPAKTVWGTDQREWLKQGLLSSDAEFKLIVSPDPIIGPDDARKSDNQASETGFRDEGEAFLAFLKAHELEKNTFIVNGDRHWKYHSIHPTGVEEFSCGTINGQNSRPGVAPGDPRGTDPDGTIHQPYLQPIPDGGFLEVSVTPDREGPRASILFRFWGEHGALEYAVRRWGNRPPIKVGPWPKTKGNAGG